MFTPHFIMWFILAFFQCDGVRGQSQSVQQSPREPTTPTTTISTAKQKLGGNVTDFQVRGIERHNFYRRMHPVEPLALSSQLNDIAMQCAAYYANSRRSIDHTCNLINRNEMGENLYWTSETQPEQTRVVESATKSWYDEISLYNYDNPGFDRQTGHFTQVVWKNTKALGIGVSSSPSYGTVVVAVYSPPGNFIGQFPENVLRPLTSSTPQSQPGFAIANSNTTTTTTTPSRPDNIVGLTPPPPRTPGFSPTAPGQPGTGSGFSNFNPLLESCFAACRQQAQNFYY